MTDREFLVMRDDGYAGPFALGHVDHIARERIRRGAGPFRRKVNGKDSGHPQIRKVTLEAVHQTLLRGKVGDVLTVRKRGGDIVLRVREAAPVLNEFPRVRASKWCRFMAAHEPSIHYSQARPTPQYQPGTTTMTLDCSGMAETVARWSGLPDPSGLGWGNGNTDSMLEKLKPIRRGELLPGDYALWHIGDNGLHVATIVEGGRDPLIMSHGAESGPILVRLSNYHHDGTLTFLAAG